MSTFASDELRDEKLILLQRLQEEQKAQILQQYQHQLELVQQQSCEFTLSTNPPNPKFRQGDWM